MTTKSLTPQFNLVKDGEADRFWVKCKEPKCYWLAEVSSEKGGRLKAFAHITIHPTHTVELHTVKTEVIRHGKEKDKL
jgi:hypothetical protein